METFHFLRPWWFLGLVPLGVMLWRAVRRQVQSQDWQGLCDAHLLPHLLVGGHARRSMAAFLLVGVAWVLAVVALAGPVWSQLPQPVFRAQSALVVLLDLSRSMDVRDVQPSRLTRAKHKVMDILTQRDEGQTALVAYASEPYVVSPLTQDANTIAAMAASLETGIVPAQGSRPSLAVERAAALLLNSGASRGDVLLITDEADDPSLPAAIQSLTRRGYRLSILGVGTAEGAPIPHDGGFLEDGGGAIVMPKLDSAALRSLARMGQGRYAELTFDDQDLHMVLPSVSAMDVQEHEAAEAQRSTDLWREEGPWVVLGVLALALPAFRPGWLGAFLLFWILAPAPGQAWFSDDWWRRADQQGARALAQGEPGRAAGLFTDPSWRGVANYRAGNFQQAAEAFAEDASADGHFNRGNALARSGQLQDALDAYRSALQQNPAHEDAQHNMQVIQNLLEPQGETSSPSSSDKQQPSDPQQSAASQGGQSRDDAQAAAGGEGREPSEAGREQDGRESSGQESHAGAQAHREPVGHESSPDMSPEEQDRSGSATVADGEEGEEDTGDQERVSMAQQPQKSQSSEDSGQQDDGTPMPASAPSTKPHAERELQQEYAQWLRRIPDDPGGLLRRKFMLQHRRRVEAGHTAPSDKTW